MKILTYLSAVFILMQAVLFSAGEKNYIDNGELVKRKHITIKGIEGNAAVVTEAFPWEANSLVVFMENGEVLIVDTLYTPQAMNELLQFIREKAGNKKVTAVNTHFHIDRLGGNRALKMKNIPIYGSSLIVKMIQERGKGSLKQMIDFLQEGEIKNYYKNFQFEMPDRVFDGPVKELIFGNERAVLEFPGAGHSLDNMIVYLPGKKIIFGGCFVFEMNKKNTGFTADGDIKEWKLNINKLKTDGYKIIIPGHGLEGGVELIEHTRNVLEIE